MIKVGLAIALFYHAAQPEYIRRADGKVSVTAIVCAALFSFIVVYLFAYLFFKYF